MGTAWNGYFRRRYAVLFYSLLSTMVIGPFSSVLGLEAGLIELCLAFNLLAAVIPVGRRNATRLALVALLGVALLMRVIAIWLGQKTPTALSLGVWTLAGLLTPASALKFAVSTETVDREHVYAALGAYLLVGSFFGILYWVLEQVWSGTFSGPGEFSRLGAIYFSFVTLATLGYGDIVPRSDLARGLVIVEAVGGQLFLAVLVARLVSMYAARSRTG